MDLKSAPTYCFLDLCSKQIHLKLILNITSAQRQSYGSVLQPNVCFQSKTQKVIKTKKVRSEMGAIYQQKQESIQFYEIVHSTENTCIK